MERGRQSRKYQAQRLIVARGGIPDPIIQRVNRELANALPDEEVAIKIHNIGPLSEGAGTPAQLAEFLAAEHQRWAQITNEIGVLPE